MTESKNNREASATIRGYVYQFDATIRKILASDSGDSCTVEDVEDFDIHTSDLSSYFQCKYYAAQKLTPSKLRDAVLPMLKNYVSLKKSERNNKRYHLYGHFKESFCENRGLSFETLKSILVRRQKIKNKTSTKSYILVDMQEEIGASNDDLEGFVQQFSLEFGAEYEEHRRTTIAEIESAAGVTKFEAENYLYPTALTLISTLACEKTAEKRTISKEAFLLKVRPNQALYSIWSLKEKSKKEYCRKMRSKYFCYRNIDPYARFFILELPEGTSETEIIQTLLAIRKKWSSHRVRRKPDNDRYAPYIFLKNVMPERLSSIKNSLHQKGCVFVDGYPFQGSDFSLASLNQKQTYQNSISLRFINSETDLRGCLSGLAQNISIYQFFYKTPLDFEDCFSQVCIPINTTNMISDII